MTFRKSFHWVLVAGLPFGLASTGFAESKDKAKTKTIKIDDLQMTIPITWKQKTPSRRLRKAQFAIPAAKGDKKAVDLFVYEFDGGGGSVSANVRRWIGQFQARGRKVKVTQGVAPQGKYTLVDITGTYNEPVGPPIRRQTKPLPNARMLAVILEVKKAGKVYYIKFPGSGKTVSANAAAFRASIGADAKKETEWKLSGSKN